MDKINWKNTNVLVTGADGFIGSNVAKDLVEKGAYVVTVVRDVKKTSSMDILNIKNKIDI